MTRSPGDLPIVLGAPATFQSSSPQEALAEHLGLTAERVAAQILSASPALPIVLGAPATFQSSSPQKALAEHLGLTAERVAAQILSA